MARLIRFIPVVDNDFIVPANYGAVNLGNDEVVSIVIQVPVKETLGTSVYCSVFVLNLSYASFFSRTESLHL
jgi:hypothetical protein